MINLWAALWRSNNRLDGRRQHIINGDDCLPVLFRKRRECRAFIKEKYGYIAERPDLQEEPHGRMTPLPVKVKLEVVANKRGRE